MAKARNPKPEIRKKPEARSPKGASSAAPAAAPARRTHASPPLGGRPPRISDFGFRVSAFGFPSRPNSTENSEQPGSLAAKRPASDGAEINLVIFLDCV